jgi:Domain of unknown function (DUF4333)
MRLRTTTITFGSILAFAVSGCGDGAAALTDGSLCRDWNRASTSTRVAYMRGRGFSDTTDFAPVTAPQAASLLSNACGGASDADPSAIGDLADTLVGRGAAPARSDGGSSVSTQALERAIDQKLTDQQGNPVTATCPDQSMVVGDSVTCQFEFDGQAREFKVTITGRDSSGTLNISIG